MKKRRTAMKQIRTLLCVLLTLILTFSSLPSYAFSASPERSTESESETSSPVDEPVTDSEMTLLDSVTYFGDEKAGGIREVSALREESIKHFAMTDGTYRAVSYASPVHRMDENGEWIDIDNSLTLQSYKGNELYATEDLRTVFAKSFTANELLFLLSEDGYEIGMGLVSNQLNADATVTPIGTTSITNAPQRTETVYYDSFEEASAIDNRSSILYTNVQSNTDLEYVLVGNDVKENIIVKAAGTSYVYRFTLALSGLTPTLYETGEIGLADSETGEGKYTIPAPYMYDANGATSTDVAYTLTSAGSGTYTLTVTASKDWINAEGRAFPVVIDPTITVQSGFYDTYILSVSPSTNFNSASDIRIANNTIAYIKFPMPTLPAIAEIDSAFLKIYTSSVYSEGDVTVGAYQMLESWMSTSITWNSAATDLTNFGYSTELLSSSVLSAQMDELYRHQIEITPAAQAWHANSESNFGIALRYLSGDNDHTYLKSNEASSSLKPRVDVQYILQIPSGVYAIRNYRYSSSRMTVAGNGSEINQNLQYKDMSVQPDSFERFALFKITKSPKPSSGYIIRSMLNNRHSFAVAADGTLKTKIIPEKDSQVEASDTYNIRWSSHGYLISPYNEPGKYIMIDSAETNDLLVSAGSSIPNSAYWTIEQYTGAAYTGVDIFKPESIDLITGNEVFLTPAPYSTVTNINSVYMYLHTNTTIDVVGTWHSSDSTFELILHQGGSLYVGVAILHETGVEYYQDVRIYLVKNPIIEGTYFVKNKATQKYMDIEGPSKASGAIIQQWTYHGADQSKWELIHVSDDYYRIKSIYSNLYLGIDASNSSLIKQYSTLNNYTLWKIETTSTGGFRFTCKALEESRVIDVPSSNSGNGVDLLASTYTDDSDYTDEWLLERVPIYTLHILNYYDNGYLERYSETEAQAQANIKSYTESISRRFLELFGISIVISDASYFNSIIDQCKGGVSSSNIDSLCTHTEITHTNRDILRDQFKSAVIEEEVITTYILWSGHRIISPNSDWDGDGVPDENRSCSSGAAILMIEISDSSVRSENSVSVLMHEFAHRLGAPDHYHEESIPGDKMTCIHRDICSNCESPNARPSSCIMNLGRTNINQNTVFCEGCKADIWEYLTSLSSAN